MNIKVSIIVTCHSAVEPYFEECLESINSQVVKPHEVIVIVDGYNKPMIYPNTITVIRDKSKGVAYSRDQGVKIATGNYLLFIDADDVIPENYIKEMVSSVMWKKADIVYPSGLLWCKWGTEAPKENAYFDPPETIILEDILKRNCVLISSLMKKEIYEKIGGFDSDLIMFEDWYFFLKAFLLKYKFVRASTFLKYRQRTLSRNHVNEDLKFHITEKIRKMIFDEYPKLKSKFKKK